MRKQLARAALAAGAVAAAFSLAVPAYAATWTASGDSSGTWTATLVNGTSATIKDTTTGSTIVCPVSTGQGTVKQGTGLSGSAIAAITFWWFGSSTSPCTGTDGITFVCHLKTGASPVLNALSYSAPTTSGNISNVDIVCSVSDIFGNCTAELTGTVNVTYTNGTGILQFTGSGTLTVVSASGSGCAGVVTAGSSVAVTAEYQISPATLTFTSP